MKALPTVQWGSIAVSLNKLSLADRVFVCAALAATIVLSFPDITHAQVAQDTPLQITIENPTSDSLPKYLETGMLDNGIDPEALKKMLPLADWVHTDPRLPLLKEYLQNKNSPLAPYANVLLEQYHYRLIIGISFAESNFCKHQIKPRNCWGIGGTHPESYATYPDAIARANQLIDKYMTNGMKNPRLMHNTWVGWDNDNWVTAVEQVTHDMESRGI